MRPHHIISFAAAACVLAACGGGTSQSSAGAVRTAATAASVPPASSLVATPQIVVTAPTEPVNAGETATFRVENNESFEIGYNFCSNTKLERREGMDAWAADTTRRLCTMELATLGAKQARQERFKIPGEAVPGEYRLSVTFTRTGGIKESFVVRTGAFVVARTQ